MPIDTAALRTSTDPAEHAAAFIDHMTSSGPERDPSRIHLTATEIEGWFAQAIEAATSAGHSAGHKAGTEETALAAAAQLEQVHAAATAQISALQAALAKRPPAPTESGEAAPAERPRDPNAT